MDLFPTYFLENLENAIKDVSLLFIGLKNSEYGFENNTEFQEYANDSAFLQPFFSVLKSGINPNQIKSFTLTLK